MNIIRETKPVFEISWAGNRNTRAKGESGKAYRVRVARFHTVKDAAAAVSALATVGFEASHTGHWPKGRSGHVFATVDAFTKSLAN